MHPSNRFSSNLVVSCPGHLKVFHRSLLQIGAMDFKQRIIFSVTDEEQRIFIKFCLLQDHSAGVIHSNLVRMLGSQALPRSTIERWCTKFRRGETSAEKASGGDRSDPAIVEQHVEQVQACFHESRHWSLRSLASNTGLPYATVQRIVTEKLRMTKVLDKWVPHILTPEQRDLRVLCSSLNLRLLSQHPTVLKRTLTID